MNIFGYSFVSKFHIRHTLVYELYFRKAEDNKYDILNFSFIDKDKDKDKPASRQVGE